jgi:hypothetical protein
MTAPEGYLTPLNIDDIDAVAPASWDDPSNPDHGDEGFVLGEIDDPFALAPFGILGIVVVGDGANGETIG